MKTVSVIVFACTVCVQSAFASDAAADTAAEKQAAIQTLLAQTGQTAAAVGQQFAQQITSQMSAMLKRVNPNVDPRGFVIIEAETNAVIREEFISGSVFNEAIQTIYAKHFSTTEIQQMVAFNDTALGRKLIRVMPQITQEGILAGQKIGESLAPIINQRVQARFEGIR